MSLAPGSRLGAYEIVALLGAGGMGEVYRARDLRLNRHVAIKILPAAVSTERERLQRFEQEARAAAALNHPNILAVHDIGERDGAPYIVSELLEGESLRERLAAGPLPVRKAVEYDTGVETLAAILKEDVRDFPVERHVPPALERIVDRCLEKSPGARFGTAGDLAFALDALTPHSDLQVGALSGTTSRRKRLANVAPAVLVAVAVGVSAAFYYRSVPDERTLWLSILPPDGTRFTAVSEDGGALFALSPDGERLAFVAEEAGARPTLRIRTLSSLAVQTLPGTESATFPFWSPDGQSLGFFAERKLKRIDVGGGPPQIIAAAPQAAGGTWGPSGWIVFSPTTGPLPTGNGSSSMTSSRKRDRPRSLSS